MTLRVQDEMTQAKSITRCGRWLAPPSEVHGLISRTGECGTVQGKRDLTDVIK